MKNQPEPCGQPFPNNHIRYFSPVIPFSERPVSTLAVINKSYWPVILSIYKGAQNTKHINQPYLSVSIDANKSLRLNLTNGIYSFAVNYGSVWCEQSQRFQKSKKIHFRGAIKLLQGQIGGITLVTLNKRLSAELNTPRQKKSPDETKTFT